MLSLLLLPLASPWIYSYVTLCYFLFSIRWHQKGSVCFSPSNITMNIYLTFVIFYLYSVVPKSYIMLFFISYSVTPNGSVCFYPSNHHEYISYIMLFFIFYFGGTKILHYVIFYLVFVGTKRAQFASGTSSITMNIFLRYVIFYLVFGGTKRAQFASPHLTSPWIYILRCNFLFHIRWHQNLTLCYFLFPIRWHQMGSVCFCSL